MEDDQPQIPSVETPAVETQQAAPTHEATPEGPSLAEALEIAKAKAQAESSKRDAAQQSRQNAALEKRVGREPREPRGDRPPRPSGEIVAKTGAAVKEVHAAKVDVPIAVLAEAGRKAGPVAAVDDRSKGSPIRLEKLISDSLYLGQPGPCRAGQAAAAWAWLVR